MTCYSAGQDMYLVHDGLEDHHEFRDDLPAQHGVPLGLTPSSSGLRFTRLA
jgi:hypothetical protein